ncbi:protein of unknown function [Methylocaldum szegediense]|uniref:Uncharacterized protein n=1 Tax=Methylocaldum szegediense TaxID=73780 RepID=A0ABM9I8G5_9GAMM|nr:protein of unknown function [Methylocaldum szegediense]
MPSDRIDMNMRVSAHHGLTYNLSSDVH